MEICKTFVHKYVYSAHNKSECALTCRFLLFSLYFFASFFYFSCSSDCFWCPAASRESVVACFASSLDQEITSVHQAEIRQNRLWGEAGGLEAAAPTWAGGAALRRRFGKSTSTSSHRTSKFLVLSIDFNQYVIFFNTHEKDFQQNSFKNCWREVELWNALRAQGLNYESQKLVNLNFGSPGTIFGQ